MNPDLSQLFHLIDDVAAYRRLVDELRQGSAAAVVPEAARPYMLGALYYHLRRPMLVVTARPEKARELQEQLAAWCHGAEVRLFPEPDALPYQRLAADVTTGLERVQALSALAGANGPAPLTVVSAPALMQKVAARRQFAAAFHTVKAGMSIDLLDLLRRWAARGYSLESNVDVPGAMSHRGGIVDIYPPTSDLPARLEFFGNTVESIRLFDPSSQRSVKEAQSIVVGPATEMLAGPDEMARVLNGLDLSNCQPEARRQFEEEIDMLLTGRRPDNMPFYAPLFHRDSLPGYLPENALLVMDGPDSIKQAIDDLDTEAAALRAEKLAAGELPANFPPPYLNRSELEAEFEKRPCLNLSAWSPDEAQLNFTPAPGFSGQLPVFIKKVKQLLRERSRLVLVSHQAGRLAELFDEADIIAPPLAELKEIPPPGGIALVQGALAEGWALGNACLFTDSEIFGFVKQHRPLKKHPVPRHKLFIDIVPGDYVVHIEHGIGKFTGVTKRRTENVEKEYLVLEYAAGDKLLVPTEQIDRVNRYVGAGEQAPALSRLGTSEWRHTRQKTSEDVEKIAEEMLNLYASREVVPGYAFSPDTVWQTELEAAFPYVETPDQAAAVEHVKQDMEKAKPMDRLVCGDVGYGKTEVAVRAAFKAVMDGKQVAVLVPTTVLAEQHYVTFSERLRAFPARIEVLSRFRTPREQKAVIEGMAAGAVDICIGTHRLLQKDVVFKDLGLLIIDEEQRFGVAHKEHFKKLRQEVDVLTLSATPIPRTLHMSLVGVRDMSTMATPPEERLPIKTYVAEFSDRLVREAILRELERNGQVFFVHNRVQSIAIIAAKLQSLVPEARIAIGHGQMAEDQLETVMAAFTRGESDVLVCTTIIESGLDLPNANTLIVNQADKFGLTQLYQLRGRIGRGTNLAYAYFLYDREKRLSPTAQRRLKTIFEATELGAGFGIAMKDLEIRGAGTLLGTRQSGYISAVGFNLYCQLLAEAVETQKARIAGKPKFKQLPPPTIDLPLPAFIPEDYVTDLNTRLGLYRSLAGLDKVEQVDALAQDLLDRFGPPPAVVKDLLYALKIKILAAKAGIESVSTEDDQIVLRRFQGMHFDRQPLESLLKGLSLRDGVRVSLNQVSLSTKRLGGQWQSVLEKVLQKIA